MNQGYDCPWPENSDIPGECLPRWRSYCETGDPTLPVGHPDCPTPADITTTTVLVAPTVTSGPLEVLPVTGVEPLLFVYGAIILAWGVFFKWVAKPRR